MIDSQLERASLLIRQQRYTEAQNILIQVIASNSDDLQPYAMLAEVLVETKELEEAERITNLAIEKAPHYDVLYYIKARVMLHQEKYVVAEENLAQAVQINPNDGDYFALWSSVKLIRKKYPEALELANKALEVDPDNIHGLNMRSTALLRLNKKEESFNTIEGALGEDPNNAYTHTNYGWGLLEKGDHKKALEHFKKALSINPEFEYARTGMAEALKSRYFVYKQFLSYTLWISRLSSGYQWAFILGMYLGFQYLEKLANDYPVLSPYLTPLLILMGLVAFSTWVIGPISNLFLRLNVYGRHLLERDEIRNSNYVGICLIVFIVGIIGYLISGVDPWLTVIVFGFAMMVPCGSMFARSRYKNVFVIYTIGLGILGIAAIGVAFFTGNPLNLLSSGFIMGFVGYQWVSNLFRIK